MKNQNKPGEHLCGGDPAEVGINDRQPEVSGRDICTCCGEPVPEGRQVCWQCENEAERKV